MIIKLDAREFWSEFDWNNETRGDDEQVLDEALTVRLLHRLGVVIAPRSDNE